MSKNFKCFIPYSVGLNFAFYAFVSQNMLHGMANRVDPDQTAPLGAVWSGSSLFAYVILSETLVYEILGHLLQHIYVVNIAIDYRPSKLACPFDLLITIFVSTCICLLHGQLK